MVVLQEEWWTTSDVEQKLCDLLRYLEQPRSAQIMLYFPCWTPNIVHSLQSLVSRPTFESLFLTSLGKLVDGDYTPVADILTHCTPVFKGARPTINLPGLQTLTLRSSYPEAYKLHTPNIQALSCHIFLSSSRELDAAAWALIPRMPLSVTKLTLELVVDTPRSSSDEFPSFGDYDNNVEHLTLNAQLDPMAQIHDRVLDAIDSLFSAARQKNLLGLRTVSFKFKILCNFEIALRTLRPNATWASLDAHLNTLLRSGRLESLFFDFHFSDRLGNLPNSKQDRSLQMSEFMEDCLPHISRSDIIKIKALESP
ncbi:hypothetical protein ONZ45_g4134 [Pleurotus djamor]|nr:hypothetical protein ONZ45_g4134 [Pleurotus djamor]